MTSFMNGPSDYFEYKDLKSRLEQKFYFSGEKFGLLLAAPSLLTADVAKETSANCKIKVVVKF